MWNILYTRQKEGIKSVQERNINSSGGPALHIFMGDRGRRKFESIGKEMDFTLREEAWIESQKQRRKTKAGGRDCIKIEFNQYPLSGKKGESNVRRWGPLHICPRAEKCRGKDLW